MADPDDIGARIDELKSEITSAHNDPAYRQTVIDRHIAALRAELGQATWSRYEDTHDDADLRDAVSTLEQARETLPDDPAVAWWLATALADRYSLSGERTDIDRVVDLYAQVAAAPDIGPDDEVAARELAGRAYRERFGLSQRPDDADGAIEQWTAYLDIVDDPDPGVLVELASLLQNRAAPGLLGTDAAGRAAGIADVARAREISVRALGLVPAHGPLRTSALTVTAAIEWSQYQVSRALDDLETVTTRIAEAAAADDHSDDEVSQNLDTLRAMVASERMIRGRPVDAGDADAVSRVARSLMPPGATEPVLPPSMLRGAFSPELIEERRRDLRERHAGLSEDDPSRPMWALAQFLLQMHAVDVLREEPDIPAMARLLDEAEAAGKDNDQMRGNIAVARGMLGLFGAARGNYRGVDEAVRLIEDNRNVVEPGSDLDQVLQLVLSSVPHLGGGGATTSDVTLTDPADALAARRVLEAAVTGHVAGRRDDRKALRAATDELADITERSAIGPAIRQLATTCLIPLRMLLVQAPRVGTRERSVMLAMAALARTYPAIAVYDETANLAAVRETDAALRELPEADAEVQDLRVQLAGAYVARIEAFRTFSDADIVVRDLGTVLPFLDPSRRTWSQAKSLLAEASRIQAATRPDSGPSSAAALGLEGLEGYAWRVLLAPDTDSAAAEALGAVAEARTVVTQFLADGAAEPAMRALDASRGLVLLAATTARDIPRALNAAGRSELAAEWTAHAPASADLRKRSIEALVSGAASSGSRASGTGARLLDPPSLDEIRSALGRARADALIYLAPLHSDDVPVAVVVPAAGEPEILRLSVRAAKFSALDAYLASELSGRDRTSRDAMDRDPSSRDAMAVGAPHVDEEQALDALADWAWHAAMREVTAWCARHGLTEPKLVLVPMAEFGLVPWHAARTPDGHYLIKDVTISYAVSARLFCENAKRPSVPSTTVSLIVGDPTGDLPSAGEEAEAIHATLYPGATYLGRATHNGTVEQVVDWLHGALGAPAGVVHLACHGGVARTGRDSAFLELAGGNLAAERLISMAQREPDGYQIGAVVLAACSTGLSGRAYDEAFSLVSAFGMSGARSVIGSLWKVPDDTTSLLMYVFHHYLQHEKLGTAEALRRAQLWMLDESPRPLPGMPEAMWRRACSSNHTSMIGWAGFTHSGQW